jgi:hypothetical protein
MGWLFSSKHVAEVTDAVEKLCFGGLTRSEGDQKCLGDGQRSRTTFLISPFFRAAPGAVKRRTFSTASTVFATRQFSTD